MDTGLLALDLADEVRVARSEEPGVQLELSGSHISDDIPRDGRNLAARAAEVVLAHAVERGAVESNAGVRVHVVKNVPSGAGLGGGSADASAALVGTARALEVELAPGDSRSWLSALGSDCVFFVDAARTGFARCFDRGNRVVPLPLLDHTWSVALVAPRIHCRTADVYAALERSLSGGPESSSVREKLLSRPEVDVRDGLRNCLEAAALEAFPALLPWRNLLDENSARHYCLSGSGSTFFGLFRDVRDARVSLERVVRAATESGLDLRGHWLARPAGAGAVVVPGD